MLPHSLTFWNTKHYQHEPKINGVHLRNNLSKIKNGAYVKYLDDFKSIWIHWIAWYENLNSSRTY